MTTKRWKKEYDKKMETRAKQKKSPKGVQGGHIETRGTKWGARRRWVCSSSFNMGGSLIYIKQYSETIKKYQKINLFLLRKKLRRKKTEIEFSSINKIVGITQLFTWQIRWGILSSFFFNIFCNNIYRWRI